MTTELAHVLTPGAEQRRQEEKRAQTRQARAQAEEQERQWLLQQQHQTQQQSASANYASPGQHEEVAVRSEVFRLTALYKQHFNASGLNAVRPCTYDCAALLACLKSNPTASLRCIEATEKFRVCANPSGGKRKP